ncbi:WD40 repeat domain-containing protein [Oculatella sp. FACHB-28]|uniref:WD40 repeat domain-containing protein n=1 Tax=Oculatella sp. FACHB-28 TaxID=2692845 RepID=UPI0016883E71|nr:WD40 repeat domain-containing protein [Oculatella sp. FACHB-28]MBD2057085.1 WD40 repeat domain-containing protein [Oculatella sp. FACHB-28]
MQFRKKLGWLLPWIGLGVLAASASTVTDQAIAGAEAEIPSPTLVWTAAADPRGEAGTSETAEFSPDSQFIVSGGGDGKFRLWRVADGSLVWEGVYWDGSLDDKQGEVEAVFFSPDGEQIAVSGNTDGIKIYRASDGSLLTALEGDGADGIAFSPNGQFFAAPSHGNNSQVKMYDPGDWSLRYGDRISHRRDINSIDFTQNSEYVLSGSADRTVKISRASDGRLVRTVRAANNGGSVKSVRLSPDGELIATANGNEDVAKVFRFDTGEQIAELEHGTSLVEAVAFSPDGKYLATGGGGSERQDPNENFGFRLYRVSDFSLQQQITEHTQGVEYIDFSLDGQYIVTASEDGTIKLWSISNPEQNSLQSLLSNPNAKTGATMAIALMFLGAVLQWRRTTHKQP